VKLYAALHYINRSLCGRCQHELSRRQRKCPGCGGRVVRSKTGAWFTERQTGRFWESSPSRGEEG
jgi:predicted amidophosphoribosyltransferase